ncbi:MAG: protoheme IX farnesyltransferase, partial [Pseudomonadota bacterium]|nr:protoheme IX farnesyltransferase [Pseudomonadota bacterium]
VATAIAPWALGLTGAIYGISAGILSGLFLLFAILVGLSNQSDPAAMKAEKRLFAFSILYLFMIFGALVADRFLGGVQG